MFRSNKRDRILKTLDEARQESFERSLKRDAEDEAWRKKADQSRLDRVSYLSTVQAVPTAPLLYALWLKAWLEAGGDIGYYGTTNYAGATMHVIMGGISPSGPHSKQVDSRLHVRQINRPDYASGSPRPWTPTVGTDLRIPEGYGANSMDLLVMPQVTPIRLAPTSDDPRSGWEWGHTTVMTLTLQNDTLVAEKNDTGDPSCYPDIHELIKKHTMQEFTSMARDVIEQSAGHGRWRIES